MDTQSQNVTPHRRLGILWSHPCIKFSSRWVSTHFSAAYRIADLIHASYTLALCLRGRPLLLRRPVSSLHLNQAVAILCLPEAIAPTTRKNITEVCELCGLYRPSIFHYWLIGKKPRRMFWCVFCHLKKVACNPDKGLRPVHLWWLNLLQTVHSMEVAFTSRPQMLQGYWPVGEICIYSLPDIKNFYLRSSIFQPS